MMNNDEMISEYPKIDFLNESFEEEKEENNEGYAIIDEEFTDDEHLNLEQDDYIWIWEYPLTANSKMILAQITSIIIDSEDKKIIECVVPSMNYEIARREAVDYEPILLNNDFLIDNGFKFFDDGTCTLIYDKYEPPLILKCVTSSIQTPVLLCNIGGKQTEIYYVNELQHLLNLLRSHKLIKTYSLE